MPKGDSSQSPESAPTNAEVQPKVNTPSPPPKVDTSVLPVKADYVADLLNMFTIEAPTANGSDSSSKDDNSWAGFQCKCLSFFERLSRCFVYTNSVINQLFKALLN